MGSVHIATQYLVDWQGLKYRSEELEKILKELEDLTDSLDLPDVLDWKSEDGNAYELDIGVLLQLAKHPDVPDRLKEFCNIVIENTPEYNNFARLEIF